MRVLPAHSALQYVCSAELSHGESKGRVDSCAWEKSEKILPLLLDLKDEGHSTNHRWRQRHFRCKDPAAQGLG